MQRDPGIQQYVVIVLFIVVVIAGGGLFLIKTLENALNGSSAASSRAK